MRDGRCLGMAYLHRYGDDQQKIVCAIHTVNAVIMFWFVVNCMVSCGWRVCGGEGLGQDLGNARFVECIKCRSSSKMSFHSKWKQPSSSRIRVSGWMHFLVRGALALSPVSKALEIRPQQNRRCAHATIWGDIHKKHTQMLTNFHVSAMPGWLDVLCTKTEMRAFVDSVPSDWAQCPC